MELDPKNHLVRFLTATDWHSLPFSPALAGMQRHPETADYSSYNICTLAKESVVGILTASFLVLLFGMALIFGLPAWLMYFFSDLYVSPLTYGLKIDDFFPGWLILSGNLIFVGLVVCALILGAACAIVLVITLVQEAARNAMPAWPSAKPSWKKEIYYGIKDKYCVLVKLKKVSDDV